MKTSVFVPRISRALRLIAPLSICGAIAACSSTTGPKDGATPPAAITALPRALTATEEKVRNASNDFSFALVGTVTDAQKTSNTFLSPLSASYALGMTMNGANGATYDEMVTALQLRGLTLAEINAGYKSLTELLMSLDPSVQMRIANSIWYRNTFTVLQPFLSATKTYFNAEVKALNFNDKAPSLAAINGWVSSATNDKIKKVLDTIDDDQMMFLINAIYFKGTWRDQFEPAKTVSSQFTTSTGASQPVQLMNRSGSMSYAETATYQAVDLPYGNTAFSMTVVLPKAGVDVNTVAKGLSTAGWQTLTSSLHSATVNLALPKLKLEYERKLNPDLQALGMVTAFTDFADFRPLSPTPVVISFVKQNSFVDINEEGTEAAAVTVVGMVVTSAPQTVTMRVDRPYLFVIRERLSGTVLFIGRIVKMPG